MGNLRSQLETWVLVKLLTTAFDRIEVEHLGTKLGETLDKQFSPKDSQKLQGRLAMWLRQVAGELDA